MDRRSAGVGGTVAGPAVAVTSEEQLLRVAAKLVERGTKMLKDGQHGTLALEVLFVGAEGIKEVRFRHDETERVGKTGNGR